MRQNLAVFSHVSQGFGKAEVSGYSFSLLGYRPPLNLYYLLAILV
jgi:hypothetical protein